jgi:hypothetical protein
MQTRDIAKVASQCECRFEYANTHSLLRFALTSITMKAKYDLFTICLLGLMLFLPAAVQAQFVYTTTNDTITITGYTGTAGEVSIPASINGLPVTGIGAYALDNNTNITSLVIPNTVTAIGDWSFNNCINLTNAVIPYGVLNIGDFAFQQSGLTSIVIPDSVTNVGYSAFFWCFSVSNVSIGTNVLNIGANEFFGCTNLTTMNIPNSVRTLGSDAFDDCVRLTNVVLGNSVATISEGAFINCTSLPRIAIPSGVTIIPDSLFYGCLSLTNVIIGDDATTIGGEVFQNCGLTSITIPNSVTSIGEGAFSGCNGLTNVILPYGLTSIADDTFEYTGLKSITIPGNIASIGEYAFAYTPLTSVTVLSYGNLASIGEYAFSDCPQLANFYFMGAAPSADNTTFSGSPTTVYYVPGYPGWGPTFGNVLAVAWNQPYFYLTNNGAITITGYTGTGGVVSIPVTISNVPVTGIGPYALDSLSTPTSIVISTNITNIAYAAFDNCPSLTAINVSPGNPNFSSVGGVLFNENQTTLIQYPAGNTSASYLIPNGVTDIGDNAFDSCVYLNGVTIPGSVTNIGDYAFLYDELYSATIGNSVINIGAGAFEFTYLASVTIPDSVTSIGSDAFFDCFNLANVSISDNVSGIGPGAFEFTELSSVTFPISLATIGDYAFANCGDLGTIIFDGNAPNVDLTDFTNSPAEAFYLPWTTGWSATFAGLLTEPLYSYTTNSGVITLTGYNAPIEGYLTGLAIPEAFDGLPVTGVAAYAFDSDDSLTNVTIPGSITNIGDRAFAECTNISAFEVAPDNPVYSSTGGVLFNENQTALIQYPDGNSSASYTIPGGVASIGDYAFADSHLKTVTIPGSVTSIGQFAFSDDVALTGITLPDGVTNIGSDAFDTCEGLASVTLPNRLSVIGNSVFDDCSSLTNITIPNSVTGIGMDAFEACSRLTQITIPDSVTNIASDAFQQCTRLQNVTVGADVTSIGDFAFFDCYDLVGIYFEGNAPAVDSDVFPNAYVTAYYLPGTTGWNTFDADSDLANPAVLWNPQANTTDGNFGVRSKRFGFDIIGTSGLVIIVQASTNLVQSAWSPVSTNTLTGGSSYFSDPFYTNYPVRFYRFSAP